MKMDDARITELFDRMRGGIRNPAEALELARLLNAQAKPGFEYAERAGRVEQTKAPTHG